MSLKLFMLNTFGGIKATSKVESEKESLLKDYRVFKEVQQSDELKEFLELQEKVTAESFKKLKAELKSLKFKGSPEERQLKQFEKLRGNKRLKRYYETLESSDLKRFQKLKNGDSLDRYFELEKQISRGADKEQKAEFNELKSSNDVSFFMKYPKTSAYKNFLRMDQSKEKATYEGLKEIIESEDYQKHRAYLEDPKKWENTDEYRDEQRYEALKNKQEIVLYLKYEDSNAFEFFENWNLAFEDRFENGILDETKWKTINYWAEKTVGQNFSQAGDLQAFDSGKNIHLNDRCLKIQVKKDKVNSLVWNPAFGFVENEFDYSSDNLTTGGLFESKYGIFEAKIRYNPGKSFQDVCYLAGEENSLRLNLLETGVKSQFGVSKNSNGRLEDASFSLSGLSAGKFYIFTLVWENNKLTWKINDKEIYTSSINVPDYPMFINLAALVVRENADLPHNFEIDWVKFYQRAN
ncbi:glycoside hydrolase family 16 protein [Sunxiuqinia indica]|uniref:glycoside hydrolase family 16 protein n=1 Tax=Sunxiuqinia indica TaxID=2692584 RepID=UPI00135B4146|nr:family 16 glycosylhydrolase [Sunxiuqinia indica]